MKKVFLIALLTLGFTQLRAQEGVVFKIKYLPGKTYKSDVNLVVKIDADVTGDPGLMDKLKSAGITSPVKIDVEMSASGLTQSGSVKADGSFPLDLSYKINKFIVSANGHQAPIPPTISEKGMKIAAHVDKDGIMEVDSASGRKADDSTKVKMKQMMGFFQRQIKFPDNALKPGDSFTQSSPLNIPLGKKVGGEIKINYAVTYKLISIADGKAYFDVIPNFSMDFGIGNTITANITGSGTGKLIYSIKDSFPLSNTGDFIMTFKVTSPQTKVDAKGSITSNSTAAIN